MQKQTTMPKTPLQQVVMALAASPAAARDGMVFAITNEGVLWRSSNRGETWTRVNIPGSGLAMSVALSPTFDEDSLMWVGMPEGAIIWSPDRGRTWRDSYITKTVSPVASLAVSPAVTSDGLVLAATLDDGVLRSLDRGRTWSPANFGLLDLKTLALALCPSFANEQISLVATETALFRSRNGGLSWKEVGFWEDAVQCVVFSPHFGQDRRAWVGTEQGGLMASTDGGQTWQAVESCPKVSVNALGITSEPEPWLLAGTSQGLYASDDEGKTWQPVLPDVNVLAMATAGQGANAWLFAATEEGKLYRCHGKPDRWEQLG